MKRSEQTCGKKLQFLETLKRTKCILHPDFSSFRERPVSQSGPVPEMRPVSQLNDSERDCLLAFGKFKVQLDKCREDRLTETLEELARGPHF